MIYKLDDNIPNIAAECWIAHDANIIGNVTLLAKSSVWFGATIRGDNEEIHIGFGSNIQENCVLHTDMGYPLTIGAGCTIGHKAMLHGCIIGQESLIGMGAIILNGVKIGKECFIGANALITEGKDIPDGSLAIGSPAKVIRPLKEHEKHNIRMSAKNYQQKAKLFHEKAKAIKI